MKLLILPHQLFEYTFLEINYDEIILYEHPQYFTKYKFNKKKIILHRASMKYYYDYLIQKDYKVLYIEFNKKLPKGDYIYFDPIDKINVVGSMVESPNFILNKEIYKKYRNKTDKFTFTNFYMWSKKEIKLYPDLKSKDKMNREKYREEIKIPKVPSNKSDKKYIDEAIKYVKKNFNGNYGNTDNFVYPVTHKTAKKWLKDFLKKRLEYFGPYQDFVKENETYMFHSNLSSSINIGLLNPCDILEELKKYKNKVKINSFEGYLRQLFWREYQRYCYIYANFTKNYFGNRKKLSEKWYNGTLNIVPVDNLIKDGFDTGYIHHIGRLMFIGNFMNLSGISPKQGFKWFMEFSIDSYEWVMHQNVLDMVFFVTGGLTMRKPYITSSNYILKMSNYKKDNWADKWDELYINFMKKNKKKLWKFRYHFPHLKKL
jgi:deoxyribodipyrimidine photolyase-related protein